LWRINYSQSYQGLTRDQTWAFARFAENSAAGWTSSLDPVRIVYSGDGEPFNGDDGSPYVSDVDHINPLPPVYLSRTSVILMDGSSHELRKDDMGRYPYDDSGTFYSTDGSRMIYRHTASAPYTANTLYLPDGSRYIFGPTLYLNDNKTEQRATQYIDRNGNILTYAAGSGQNSYGQWTDTLGHPLSVPRPGTPVWGDATYWVPGLGGSQISYTMRWRNLSEALTPVSNQTPPLNYAGDRNCTNSTNVSPALFNSDGSSKVCANQFFNPLVLSQIILPNNQSYTFTYNVCGEIDKVLLPMGGYERYRYAQIPPMGMTDGSYYDQANRGVVERCVSAKGDGSDEAHWQYQVTTGLARTPPYKVTITAPDNSYTELLLHMSGSGTDFGFDPARSGMIYDEKVFSPANQMLRRTLTEWTSSGPQPGGYSGAQRLGLKGKDAAKFAEKIGGGDNVRLSEQDGDVGRVFGRVESGLTEQKKWEGKHQDKLAELTKNNVTGPGPVDCSRNSCEIGLQINLGLQVGTNALDPMLDTEAKAVAEGDARIADIIRYAKAGNISTHFANFIFRNDGDGQSRDGLD
jgi:hypothetical protein